MKKRTLSFLVVLSVILLGGCYPDGPDYTEELDVVLTHNNPAYDFTAKSTYAMPDQIVKITGDVQEGQDPTYIPSATASQILARIATNMQNLGYTRVAVGSNPDLLLEPASWETTTIYYYYDYWYGWYGGYYGWGGYYPPVYASSYSTGTLLMMIIDPSDSELGGNGYPINQWTGALNGILTGKYNATRVNPLIDQAFKQSPYLKTN